MHHELLVEILKSIDSQHSVTSTIVDAYDIPTPERRGSFQSMQSVTIFSDIDSDAEDNNATGDRDNETDMWHQHYKSPIEAPSAAPFAPNFKTLCDAWKKEGATKRFGLCSARSSISEADSDVASISSTRPRRRTPPPNLQIKTDRPLDCQVPFDENAEKQLPTLRSAPARMEAAGEVEPKNALKPVKYLPTDSPPMFSLASANTADINVIAPWTLMEPPATVMNNNNNSNNSVNNTVNNIDAPKCRQISSPTMSKTAPVPVALKHMIKMKMEQSKGGVSPADFLFTEHQQSTAAHVAQIQQEQLERMLAVILPARVESLLQRSA